MLKHVFIGAGLSVALTLFDPFLLAAFSFPPQKYPGLDWVLFVEPPLCVTSGPHNQKETLFTSSHRVGAMGRDAFFPWKRSAFQGLSFRLIFQH